MKVTINNSTEEKVIIADIGVFEKGKNDYDLPKEKVEQIKNCALLKVETKK